MEVAGIEPDALLSEDVYRGLVKFLASGGYTHICTQISDNDVESLLSLIRIWKDLPESIKVAIGLIAEGKGDL